LPADLKATISHSRMFKVLTQESHNSSETVLELEATAKG